MRANLNLVLKCILHILLYVWVLCFYIVFLHSPAARGWVVSGSLSALLGCRLGFRAIRSRGLGFSLNQHSGHSYSRSVCFNATAAARIRMNHAGSLHGGVNHTLSHCVCVSTLYAHINCRSVCHSVCSILFVSLPIAAEWIRSEESFNCLAMVGGNVTDSCSAAQDVMTHSLCLFIDH